MSGYIKERIQHLRECYFHCKKHTAVAVITIVFAAYSLAAAVVPFIELPAWLSAVHLPKVPLAWAAVIVLIASVFIVAEGSYRLHKQTKDDYNQQLTALNAEIASVKNQKVPHNERANIEVINIGFMNDPYTPGETFVIRVRFKNRGAVPATKCVGTMRIGLVQSIFVPDTRLMSLERQGEQEQEAVWKDIKRLSDDSPYGNNSVTPDKEFFLDAKYPLPLYGEKAFTQEQIDDLKHSRQAIVVGGIIKYVDCYGPRETNFFLSVCGEKLSPWTDCWGHNEII